MANAHIASPVVRTALESTFSHSSFNRIATLLDSYGTAPYERERERVQLAIIKLSEGDELKLAYFLSIAKQDYRDVLLWAEYPREAKIDTPEKKREIKNMLEKFGVPVPKDLDEL